MNKIITLSVSLALLAPGLLAQNANDSVELLAYSRLNGEGGMWLAWRDGQDGQWSQIGNASIVNSDFGPWGSHKKMFAPNLSYADGVWTATWIADTDENVLAVATSPDLIKWGPQHYEISAEPRTIGEFVIDGQPVVGTITTVPRSQIDKLQQYAQERAYQDALYAETMAGDAQRFATLQPLTYTVKADAKGAKAISDKLIGIFFEDINYGADGGLYAEMVQNRDFEYAPADRGGDRNWNATRSWSMSEGNGSYEINDTDPLHPNNPHYLSIDAQKGFKVTNEGFDGMTVKDGEMYDFSLWGRGKGSLTIAIEDPAGAVVASGQVTLQGQGWHQYDCTLKANRDVNDGKLVITLNDAARVDLDMISLFPQNTFKGRKNGLRADLAQTLADLHPRFVRFPGGCVAHGDGIDNIYDWKGSIGPLEARKPLRNLWGYHQTRGLGYHEFFEFCEDIGAEPLPVLAAGVPCQNSGTKSHHSHDAVTTRGQQCGIPMEEMDAYIQDVLDLIEYANGDASTTWGAKRAAAGHPEPFNLKYIGIGNEDMITEVFVPRFKMIYEAVRAAHPEVAVVGTVGPFYEGTDYEEGWRLADELSIPYVDEHYYVAPGWMIYNQDYYDNYKRGATKVYLGEYAAHLPGRPSNLETSLAEAIYLTSVERNGDVVAMTSYAPLLSKDGRTQWRPDLIYFNNYEVRPTVDYYVQQLYGLNSGDVYVPATCTLDTDDAKARVRVGSSIVRDTATGDYIIKIANLLPVAVSADMDLSGLKLGKNVKAQVIAGSPTDNDLQPQPTTAAIKGKKLKYEAPAYSFTVIRISR